MKNRAWIWSGLGAAAVGTAAWMLRHAVRPLETVPYVDLNRYLGTWYEWARYPTWFERNCVNVTACYSWRNDGRISVVNSCRKRTLGSLRQVRGVARIVDAATNAKFKVSFFWPFEGDYWILALGRDYEYAIVGEPRRQYLWILSRTPHIDDELYETLMRKVEILGYESKRLVKTPTAF